MSESTNSHRDLTVNGAIWFMVMLCFRKSRELERILTGNIDENCQRISSRKLIVWISSIWIRLSYRDIRELNLGHIGILARVADDGLALKIEIGAQYPWSMALDLNKTSVYCGHNRETHVQLTTWWAHKTAAWRDYQLHLYVVLIVVFENLIQITEPVKSNQTLEAFLVTAEACLAAYSDWHSLFFIVQLRISANSMFLRVCCYFWSPELLLCVSGGTLLNEYDQSEWMMLVYLFHLSLSSADFRQVLLYGLISVWWSGW